MGCCGCAAVRYARPNHMRLQQKATNLVRKRRVRLICARLLSPPVEYLLSLLPGVPLRVFCPPQPSPTEPTRKHGADPSTLSNAADLDVSTTSPDPSEGADATGVEQDELATARAHLKARAGAKGRRGGKIGRGAGGQAKVRHGWPCCSTPSLFFVF